MESGRLEEEKLLVWNRLPGFNFVLVFFSILIIVIFCHLSLLCLKMALDGLKLVAAIKILQSRMLFEIRFCASFYIMFIDFDILVLTSIMLSPVLRVGV